MNYQIELIPEQDTIRTEKVIVDSSTVLENNTLIYGYPKRNKRLENSLYETTA